MGPRRKPVYGMGSVSSATMREEDLIPTFIEELEYLIKANGGTPRGKKWGELRDIKRRMKKKGYFETEDASYDLNEYLFDALNQFAPPYFYFGAHPGDGADYGFWLDEYWREMFDGEIVEDLADIPKGYRGEVMHVSDHGNMTLYYCNSKGTLREIWAIV